MTNIYRKLKSKIIKKITILSVTLKYKLYRNKIIPFSYQGNRFYYHSNSSSPRHLIESMVKLERLVESVPFQPKIVFDVGGNCGLFSALVENKFNNAKIHLFEPSEDLLKCIRLNIGQNVIVNRLAVGDKTGEIDFFVSNTSQQTNSVLRDSVVPFTSDNNIKQYKVPVITLSDYCNKHGIDEIDLLKIDVQGFEQAVINGLGDIIHNVKAILIEASWLDWHSVKVIFSLVENYGYKHVGVVNDMFAGADLFLLKTPIDDTNIFYTTFDFENEKTN